MPRTVLAGPCRPSRATFVHHPPKQGIFALSTDGTISIRINGEHRRVRTGMSIAELASELGFKPEKVAVERNLVVVPRSTLTQVMVEDGDELEIVHFVGGGDVAPVQDDSWSVAGRTFRSRLIVGSTQQ